MNSSGVSKAFICLQRDCQGLTSHFACASVLERLAATADGRTGGWAVTAFLLEKQQTQLPQLLPPLQINKLRSSPIFGTSPLLYNYFPCKSIPTSLVLLPFTLCLAILDFEDGAEKLWIGFGQTLLHL